MDCQVEKSMSSVYTVLRRRLPLHHLDYLPWLATFVRLNDAFHRIIPDAADNISIFPPQ
jgi:hypothetical protein